VIVTLRSREIHFRRICTALKGLRLAVLIVAATAIVGSCDSFERWVSADVEYRVQGTAQTVDITIENEGGGVSQYSDVEIPWVYSGKFSRGAFVYVSAQNQDTPGVLSSRYTRMEIYFVDQSRQDLSSSQPPQDRSANRHPSLDLHMTSRQVAARWQQLFVDAGENQ
jgi:hypothetical protein